MSDTDTDNTAPSKPTYETFDQRLWRKCSEQPLVPIGCGVTAYFLVSGIRSFYQGNAGRSQTMMRARVASQGLTIAAFVGYAAYDTFTAQQKKKLLKSNVSAEKKDKDRDARILDPDRR